MPNHLVGKLQDVVVLTPWGTLSYGLGFAMHGQWEQWASLRPHMPSIIVPGGFEVALPAFVLFAQLVPILTTYSCAACREQWWVEALQCGYSSEVKVTSSLV